MLYKSDEKMEKQYHHIQGSQAALLFYALQTFLKHIAS